MPCRSGAFDREYSDTIDEHFAMKTRAAIVTLSLLLGIAALAVLWNYTRAAREHHSAVDERSAQALDVARIPLHFEPNRGQVHAGVHFLARGPGYTLHLMPGEAVLSLRAPSGGPDKKAAPEAWQDEKRAGQSGPTLRMRLVNSDRAAEASGLARLPGRTNYFIGNDPAGWHTDVPNFASVLYKGVYPGIDLVYYGRQRELEYDFIVRPGADVSRIALGFDGTEEVRTEENGDVTLEFESGAVTLQAPVIYQERDGRRSPIAGRFVRHAPDRFGFHVDAYDPAIPLVIDPVLTYSTYLGGEEDDSVEDLAVDAAGNVYLTGRTSTDVYVRKIDANGNAMVFTNIIGGAGSETGHSVAVDASGNVYVAGRTSSFDFPTVNAFQPRHSAGTNATVGQDGFAIKLAATGDAVLYSTYIGGSHQFELDPGWLDFGTVPVGQASVLPVIVRNTGPATLSGFASPNNAQVSIHSGSPFTVGPGSEATVEIRVAPQFASTQQTSVSFEITLASGIPNHPVKSGVEVRVNGPVGTWSAQKSNDGVDDALAIAVDASGNAFITGVTSSINFPTFSPIFGYGAPEKITVGWPNDAFIMKLDPAGSPVYSTYLGGRSDDSGDDVGVDASGSAYVMGYSWSDADDFPLSPGAYRGGEESSTTGLFMVKVNPAGSELDYAASVGSGRTSGHGIAVDAAGHAHAAYTDESGATHVMKLNPAGTEPVYSTLLEATGFFGAIALDTEGNSYVTGSTSSADFPLFDALQSNLAGSSDAFVSKLDVNGDVRFSTYLGGSQVDHAVGIGISSIGRVYVTGLTRSTDFPDVEPVGDVPPIQPENAGRQDVFLVIIDMDHVHHLLYDEVTMGSQPVFSRGPFTPQQILPQFLLRSVRDTVVFEFEGRSTDGQVGLRVVNTRLHGLNAPPLTLETEIIDPDGSVITPFTLPLMGTGNAGHQFMVLKNGRYTVKVFADEGSQGTFPAPFQIHLAGNVGHARRLINGVPEVARATRLDILFNHAAPRPQGIYGRADNTAQTALFKFASPAELSQFAVAVLVPSSSSSGGFIPGTTIIRAPDPMIPLGPTTPTARTPACVGGDPTGMIVDFTQVPDPASVHPAPFVGGTVCAVIGEDDGVGVALPLESGATSLIVDMGSGQEIVDGAGDDLKVFAPEGIYAVAASNTPFLATFIPVADGISGAQSFDLSGTGLTSARYVLITATPAVTLDAVKALNVFIDRVIEDPITAGRILVGDVDEATITLRRGKAPQTDLDPRLELIAPDGSRIGEDDMGFGDATDTDLTDAALKQIDLPREGYYRFLARGQHDQIEADQSFGGFFVRLETSGQYDAQNVQVSEQDEETTLPQRTGSITRARERDSYLFRWQPGRSINIAATAKTDDLDLVLELHDPEGFLIAAADNSEGRGRNAVLQLTLPTSSFNGLEELPDPSTYRVVVSAVDPMRGTNPADRVGLDDGEAHFRGSADGEYELKVFTGALAGGGGQAAPAVASISPAGGVQGRTALEVTISGSNFAEGVQVGFSGTGVTAVSATRRSEVEIGAMIDIAENAPPGLRDVVVTNPDGRQGTLPGAFEVSARSSLAVGLSWEVPSGDGLAPPVNLSVQPGGGSAGKNAVRSDGSPERKKPTKLVLPRSASRRVAAAVTPPATTDATAFLIDEVEPNNSVSQAQVLSGPSPIVVHGNVELDDEGEILIEFGEDEVDDLEDLFVITTTAPGLTIRLDGFTSDCDLYLGDAAATSLIGMSLTAGAGFAEEIDLPDLEAGTYGIAVSIFDPEPDGEPSTPYVLTLTGVFGEAQGEPVLQQYNVYRSQTPEARTSGSLLSSVDADEPSFADIVPDFGSYYYQVTALYDQGESDPSNEATVTLSVDAEENGPRLPSAVILEQNYPNPFNPTTTIEYVLPERSTVRLEVYNPIGQRVATIVRSEQPAGRHRVQWDGRADDGSPLSSGLYLYRLQTGDAVESRLLLLVK